MDRLDIKPLSVNKVWQGRRFKTKDYKNYEIAVSSILPKLDIPDGDLLLGIKFGFSSKASDVDNCAKPFIDILQKKYKFNDKRIYRLELEKEDVKKGDEFIEFDIKSI